MSEVFTRSPTFPVVSGPQAAPDLPGFVKTFWRAGELFGIESGGQEVKIGPSGAQVEYYNSEGLVPPTTQIKAFFDIVQSNGSGDFTVNWSPAGFSLAPFHVSVTAFSPVTASVVDRVWATMRNDMTASQGSGYTLRGETTPGGLLFTPATDTIRTAPNTVVHVLAYGV